jgi:IS4 transposase
VLSKNRHENILIDELIELKTFVLKKTFRKRLIRVAIWVDKNEQVIELITSWMSWIANTISELYKSLLQIEMFVRKIKQNLLIKSFIGTTEKAVMIQIWIALIIILIRKALKAMAKYELQISKLVTLSDLIYLLR